jgi:hypothetical protein
MLGILAFMVELFVVIAGSIFHWINLCGKEPMSNSELKTTFTNHSRRQWSEEECRIFINAALCKLIDDAGGVITISVSDLYRVAPMGTLAMSLSDDDKILTLTRLKTDS